MRDSKRKVSEGSEKQGWGGRERRATRLDMMTEGDGSSWIKAEKNLLKENEESHKGMVSGES